MTVDPRQRFTRHHPCPCCGGYDLAPRGRGVRCAGFLSEDGAWCRCTRDEQAGTLTLDLRTSPPSYLHHMEGECRCGKQHTERATPVEVLDALPSQRRTYRKQETPPGTVDRYYTYFGLDGRPVHRTVRYRDPKSFRQERYCWGRWLPGLKDTPRILYRLRELMAASPGRPVFIPEGEKDVDRLMSLGLVATTNPCGAMAWQPHLSEWLTDRDVVIIQDNDDAGRARTERLYQHLRSCAKSVRVVEFPQMPEGSDISDWLDAGGTKDRLLLGLVCRDIEDAEGLVRQGA